MFFIVLASNFRRPGKSHARPCIPRLMCTMNLSSKVFSNLKIKDLNSYILTKLEIQIQSTPKIILSQLFSKQKVKKQNHEQRQCNNKKEKIVHPERLDAQQNHISSSDSCSRSTFFRSPTSEGENLLTRDLTNQVTKA